VFIAIPDYSELKACMSNKTVYMRLMIYTTAHVYLLTASSLAFIPVVTIFQTNFSSEINGCHQVHAMQTPAM